ncbi:MAG: hypothetical protein ABIT71_26775, partial [Vicinamibacteraceae bacterium]
GIVQVIGLSMLTSRVDLQTEESDVVIRPEFPKDVRFMSWDRHTDLYRQTHRDVGTWIRGRLAAADPRVQAVLRSGDPAAANGSPSAKARLPEEGTG